MDDVSSVAITLSCFSFGLYVIQIGNSIILSYVNKPPLVTQDLPAAVAQKSISADDASKLIDSTAKLTDSLSRAGPVLTSLIASILFLFVATLSSYVGK